MTTIHLHNQQNLLPLNLQKLKKNIQKILNAENCTHPLSIAIVDNPTIQKLHLQFLHKNTPTDVLAFPLQDPWDPLLGEIIVSAEQAIHVAKKLKIPPENELMLYIIHGFLHLLGYNDKTEKDTQIMRTKEKELLSLLGYPTPPSP